MPLTPAEVVSVAFHRPAAGGYFDDEVDGFLDEVADEMRRLQAENQALSAQLDQHDLAERIRQVELDCLRIAEHVRSLEAELARARQAASTARPADSRILDLAQRNADGYVAEARMEADALMEQAATRAAQLVSEAELRASTIVADARHAHAAAIAGLTAQRAAALDEINRLRESARQQKAAVGDDILGRLAEFGGGAEQARRGAA